MWLTGSSIGRKLVMAITGVGLVLFVTFHALMNAVALVWPCAYNAICEFLGANWYALIASMGLAALFVIHIIYACVLTIQNRRARGADRYAVNSRPKSVEWSSKNMLVLGVFVLAFLVVHLIQFWAKMQLAEITGQHFVTDGGMEVAPTDGMALIYIAFSNWYTPVIYIIGFVALWFHINHGFWSMFQSIGWDNDLWKNRLKKIGCWWSTIVIGLFIAQAIVFTVKANCATCCPAGEAVECCGGCPEAAAACCGEAPACCKEGATPCPDCPNAAPAAPCCQEEENVVVE